MIEIDLAGNPLELSPKYILTDHSTLRQGYMLRLSHYDIPIEPPSQMLVVEKVSVPPRNAGRFF